MDENSFPTAICIFGAAGDLAKKKLIPALFDLFTAGKLPTPFIIIGFGRTERSDEAYADIVRQSLATATANKNEINTFLKQIRYTHTTTTDNYIRLVDCIHDFETTIGRSTNRLFYLAIPPSEYEATFKELHESALASVAEGSTTFARILVEKPFGNDHQSALALGEVLGSYFDESQIFRIDHYLAKEAVQNILSFRFANVLLQKAWDHTTIEKVHITLQEKVDVHSRASFYNNVGALKDVGQNHILQMLALVAMDEPKSLTCADIRIERENVLTKLKQFTKEAVAIHAIRAQYEGYTDTEGIPKNSQTETFFEAAFYVDTPKWDNVPFIVRSGKALNEELVQIEMYCTDVASGPFETSSCETIGNKITLTLSPHEEIKIELNVKKPGRKYQVQTQTLVYRAQEQKTIGNAYEKVLLDCIDGDQTIFTTTQEVLASWKCIDSLAAAWDSIPMHIYLKGSHGPEETLFI